MTTVQAISKKQHLLYLDGLRAVAAIYVVMHHASLHYKLDMAKISMLQKLFIKTFSLGHYAVDLFIVISGFSLMLPTIKYNYELTSIWDFYRRRVKRILPPYYIALLLCIVLVYFVIGKRTGSYWDTSLPMTFESIYRHVLLINDLFLSTAYTINHSMWSIPVECRIYIFFPLLLWIRKTYGAWATLATSVSIAVILHLCLLYARGFNKDIDMETSGVDPYIILFTLGMLASDISFSIRSTYQKMGKLPWGAMLILAIFAFVFFKSFIQFRKDPNGNIETEIVDILFGLICFCLLVVCSKKDHRSGLLNKVKNIFEVKPLVFAGMFAYSIYLIHAPLQQVMYLYLLPVFKLSNFGSTVFLTLVGTGLILLVAYVFFIFFEKPFLNTKKKAPLAAVEAETAINPAP